MGSFIYSPFSGSLKWPDSCAICNSPADFIIDSTITDISDSGISWYNIRNRTLPYPICNKHRLFCFIFDLPQRTSLIWYVLAILPIALIGFLRKSVEYLFKAQLNTTFSAWFILSIYAVVFLYLFAGKYLLPVRLAKVDYHRMKVSIKNKDFFEETKMLNFDIISIE